MNVFIDNSMYYYMNPIDYSNLNALSIIPITRHILHVQQPHF